MSELCLHPAAGRRGVTVIELVLVLAIGGLVAAVATRTFRVQQRSIGTAVELAELRTQLRLGVHLLATELRTISPHQGDVHSWGGTGITIRSVNGTSVVCSRESDSALVLPPLDREHDPSPTSWMTYPQPGDSVRVLDDSLGVSGIDDVWRSYEIADLSPAARVGECALRTASTDSTHTPVRVRLAGGARLPATVVTGASVRFFRPVRYELYRSGDGLWYLGASECRAGRSPSCSTIQPVAGPYDAPGAGTGSGLQLVYLDQSGSELLPDRDDPRRIARIDVTVRSRVRTPPVWRHTGMRAAGDSIHLSVAPRYPVSARRE